MNAIRNIVKVKNKKIIIDLPADFDTTEVEVIVLPYQNHEKKIKFKEKLSSFVKNSPLYDSNIILEKDNDIGKEVELWNSYL